MRLKWQVQILSLETLFSILHLIEKLSTFWAHLDYSAQRAHEIFNLCTSGRVLLLLEHLAMSYPALVLMQGVVRNSYRGGT